MHPRPSRAGCPSLAASTGPASSTNSSSSKTSSQVMTRSRAGTAAVRQLSSVGRAARHGCVGYGGPGRGFNVDAGQGDRDGRQRPRRVVVYRPRFKTRCSVPVSERVLLALEARCWSLAHQARGTSARGTYGTGLADPGRRRRVSLRPRQPGALGAAVAPPAERAPSGAWASGPRRSAGNTVRPLRRARG